MNTVAQILTAFFQQQVLADLLNTVTGGNYSGILNGIKVALIKAPFSPNPQSGFTSFTEADFTGYAESGTITWGTAILQPDGTWATIGSLETFTVGSTPSVTNTIYGLCFFATISSVKTALWFEMFPQPVVMNLAGNAIVVIPQFSPSGQTNSKSSFLT